MRRNAEARACCVSKNVQLRPDRRRAGPLPPTEVGGLQSKGKFGGELKLARVEHGAWPAEIGVGGRDDAVFVALGNAGEENRRVVDGSDFVDVGAIERVESIDGELELLTLLEFEEAREPNIPGREFVT